MKTLLRIDASARRRGSYSRRLGDHFESCWRSAHPGGVVITRDLAMEPPPHLNDETIRVFMGEGSAAGVAGADFSERLICELRKAEEVLICSPLYNFVMPSTLKAYVDHVVRFGHTFDRDENGFHGLLHTKAAWLLTTQGGLARLGVPDFQAPALQAVLQHMGISHIHHIALEGTVNPDGELDRRLADALIGIEQWFGLAAKSQTADL